MATFKIHEDDFEKKKMKNEQKDVECPNKGKIQQKRVVLKNVQVKLKKLPLRQQNQITKVSNAAVKKVPIQVRFLK